MHKIKKIACVIPARLNSSRFPKKLLQPLNGKTLLQCTWEAAIKISLFDTVTIALDAEETADVVASFGGAFFFTPTSCQSGTERIAHLKKEKKIHGDIFVNWQADEPFVNLALIKDLLKNCNDSDADVWTLKKRIENPEEILSPHIPKVVTDAKNLALYFSRSPIPFHRDIKDEKQLCYYKHIGLYAFTASTLEKIATFTPSALEKTEQLEQLTFLYHGLSIEVHETVHETIGIDLPEHLRLAEKRFLAGS